MNNDALDEQRLQQMRQLRDAIDQQRREASAPPPPPVARPILFNDGMLKALLEGRKTQTRRLVRVPVARAVIQDQPTFFDGDGKAIPCHLGQAGDQLWVRERWAARPGVTASLQTQFLYGVDGQPAGMSKPIAWKPSLHMPRPAARMILNITSVRGERLQSISEADARAEGFDPTAGESSPLRWFHALWNGIFQNPSTRWEDDPWVWVVTFTVSR